MKKLYLCKINIEHNIFDMFQTFKRYRPSNETKALKKLSINNLSALQEQFSMYSYFKYIDVPKFEFVRNPSATNVFRETTFEQQHRDISCNGCLKDTSNVDKTYSVSAAWEERLYKFIRQSNKGFYFLLWQHVCVKSHFLLLLSWKKISIADDNRMGTTNCHYINVIAIW
jgi:hypothetical protein